jgi:hypothetical protein
MRRDDPRTQSMYSTQSTDMESEGDTVLSFYACPHLSVCLG